jgi:hypothetical protein
MHLRSWVALGKIVILRSAKGTSQRTPFRDPALAVAVLALLPCIPAAAQQPTPLFNTLPANPPAAPAPDQSAPSPPAIAQPATPLAAPAAGRVFCDQNVTAQPPDPASIPDRYRQFVGIFSDADWNPQTCAALIVETIADDGTATISYVFGPLGSSGKAAGGVLHGTGIVKDGALLFQNADGSQYAFQPFYSDLAGKWTTPKGQTYEAIFKRTY